LIPLHGPTSANLLITAGFRRVTQIHQTDVGLAKLQLVTALHNEKHRMAQSAISPSTIPDNVPAVAETAPTFMCPGARMLSGAYGPQGRSAIGSFGLEAAHAAGTGNG